jgi:hypothetical protein
MMAVSKVMGTRKSPFSVTSPAPMTMPFGAKKLRDFSYAMLIPDRAVTMMEALRMPPICRANGTDAVKIGVFMTLPNIMPRTAT